MMRPKLAALLLLVTATLAGVALLPPSAAMGGEIPVFPGAQGFGSDTRAGRGGRILKVTTLSDSGDGSLRAALEATGARTVVFEIAGTISLKEFLQIRDPFLTVAGQTAPSPGITVRGGIIINTHDVLLQHLRVRPGIEGPEDGVRIEGPGAFNIVLDHLSVSWSRDENVSTIKPVRDVTISNCLISEGLRTGYYDLLIGDKTHRASILRNLLANGNRNPRIDGDASVLVVNNLVHNSQGTFMVVGGYPRPVFATIIGNVGLPGADTMKGKTLVGTRNLFPGSRLYLSGNVYPGKVFAGKNEILIDKPPVPFDKISVLAPSQVEEVVLRSAGARPADRDPVDSRIVQQVRRRSGKIIDTPTDAGGWPEAVVRYRTLTLPARPHKDDDGDGYTNLEEYLHRMAAQVE